MFRLQKVHPPFGFAEAPQFEASYSEGLIPVVDGFCEVRLPQTRERLLKLGYVDSEPTAATKGEETMGRKPKQPKGK